MSRLLIAVCVLIILHGNATAQPKLELKPDNIEFKDVFHRLQNIYFKNTGDQVLTIDTIYYRSDLYFIRFNEYWHYPFKLNPGDSLMMDCMLSGYFNVTSNDTSDTMFIVSDSKDGTKDIHVKMEFYDDSNIGTISGRITDGENPVAGANVYFLYNGSYIIRSSQTDQYGHYTAYLPEGRYTIAAAKDSFYVSFYDQKPDPYSAKIVSLWQGSVQMVNIQLNKTKYKGYKISGKVFDSLSVSPLRRAIILLRRGDHNPSKISATNDGDPELYSVFASLDGSYSAEIASPGYYFVQSFSDYFLPSYLANDSYSSVFWQQADSVLINTQVDNKNLFMPRDSSYGGGIIEGKVFPDTSVKDSISDALVFAQSVDNNYLYSYTFLKDSNNYRIINLPYGRYKICVQKIGYPNFFSNYVDITPWTPQVNNVNIYINLSSAPGGNIIPDDVVLYPNYPNPFNPTTTVEFSVSSGTMANLKVFNVLGQEVKLLFEGYVQRGIYKYIFDGNDLSSGAYFVVLNTGNKSLVRKILLLK